MSQIRDLFDSARAPARPIGYPVTYQNRSEEQLRTEISEYVVTDHIEQSFEDLLGKMQLAQQGGGRNEIGVWVSGPWGAGKTSFTKYFGLALDRSMTIGGDPFLKLLQNQIPSAGARAMFNQVSTANDAAVVFLDLASEMVAGASIEDISAVLYLKVLQWAGYSESLKVAELEHMLEVDNKLDAFKARAKEELGGIEWVEVHNQPLVANQIAAHLATEFYPNLFRSASDFGDLTLHVSKAENKRAEAMIDLIRLKSGKQNIIFIIDEVGQYIAANSHLALDFHQLHLSLAQIGQGGVWLVATSEPIVDAPDSTPLLRKVQDKMPIQVYLEACDIKEICHKRLLTKSSAGEQALTELFDQYGASLRNATQLDDAGVYETELTKKLFVDLYPFLPAHFEILMGLQRRLLKKSVFKLFQQVLVTPTDGPDSLVDQQVGRLATSVTLYDSLRSEIRHAYLHVVEGVNQVLKRLPNDPLAHDVAKSIAVLQILENLPVTEVNLAALMHPDISAPALKAQVTLVVHNLLQEGLICRQDQGSNLFFLNPQCPRSNPATP